jgi:hypothetical protein
MLNLNTPAEADAAKAALRPLAGSGAGAFMHEGAWTGLRASDSAALKLPRIRCSAAAASQGYEPAGSASRARQARVAQLSSMLTGSMQAGAVQSGTVLSGAVQVGGGQPGATQNFNQTTRIPVIPGGVGSHPAREPEPV